MSTGRPCEMQWESIQVAPGRALPHWLRHSQHERVGTKRYRPVVWTHRSTSTLFFQPIFHGFKMLQHCCFRSQGILFLYSLKYLPMMT